MIENIFTVCRVSATVFAVIGGIVGFFAPFVGAAWVIGNLLLGW